MKVISSVFKNSSAH